MAGERIFKRRIEFESTRDFDAFEKSRAREIVLEGLAEMSPAEKRAYVDSLPEPLQKAIRNEVLLAQAASTVPGTDDGIFTLLRRTGRRIVAT